MHSFSIVALSSPRYVIDVAKSIDQHDVRVSSLINHITNRIKEQFENKFSMSWKMNQSNDEVTCHVDTSNYEHKSTFG